MSKKQKIDKTALVFNPIVFVERQLYREKRKYYFFKTIFVIINLLIFSATLAIAIITPMFLSKLYFSNASPENFYLLTAFVSAGTSLAGAIVNFLYVKVRYEAAIKHFHFIQREIIMYASKSEVYEKPEIDKDILLFNRVAKKIDYAQKKEEINE